MTKTISPASVAATVRMTGPRSAWSQAGLSLLEVVIAMAILATSVAVLSQLLDSARWAAIRASYENQAIIYAESLLSEILASDSLPVSVTEEVIEEDPAWVYSLQVEDMEFSTLSQVTLTVLHKNENGVINAEVTLVRWMAHFTDVAESSSSSASTVP